MSRHEWDDDQLCGSVLGLLYGLLDAFEQELPVATADMERLDRVRRSFPVIINATFVANVGRSPVWSPDPFVEMLEKRRRSGARSDDPEGGSSPSGEGGGR